MPIYEYRCSQCGREVEVMHPIGQAGPEACEVCGGAMRKSLSLPAIHFKGSGWAKKDAAATRSKPAPDSSKSDDQKGKGKDGTSHESGDTTGGSDGAGSTTATPASTKPKAD